MRAEPPIRVGAVIGQLTVGGAERQLVEFVTRMDRTRFEPVVYCLAPSLTGTGDAMQSRGVLVRAIGAGGARRAWRLARALREDGIGLVHSWLFIANTYAWMTRRLGIRLPLVTSARNCKSQGWAHHLANVGAFRGSARVIVNSQRVREYIVRRYAAPRSRIDVVYNGVDTERFRPAARTQSALLTVVTAGRLVTQKNPQLFVQAAARLHRIVPETRFVWIGDGPLRHAVADAVARAGLGEVLQLAGEWPDPASLLRRADVFWLTSSWEGLPNAVLEAMACGLPVVATDAGGTREILRSGREGFLVEPNSVDEFVQHGLALVRDGDMRKTMGMAARQRAQEFSLARMVAGTQSVYDKALGGPA